MRACVRAGPAGVVSVVVSTGALSVSVFTHTQRILHKPIDCILLGYLWLCSPYAVLKVTVLAFFPLRSSLVRTASLRSLVLHFTILEEGHGE